MIKAARLELDRYTELLKPMRYRTTRKIDGNGKHTIWSVTVV